MANAEVSIKFWSELQDNPIDHGKNIEWIMTIEKLQRVTEKVILTSLKKMFPYILGKCQIGKRQALMDYMDSS